VRARRGVAAARSPQIGREDLVGRVRCEVHAASALPRPEPSAGAAGAAATEWRALASTSATRAAAAAHAAAAACATASTRAPAPPPARPRTRAAHLSMWRLCAFSIGRFYAHPCDWRLCERGRRRRRSPSCAPTQCAIRKPLRATGLGCISKHLAGFIVPQSDNIHHQSCHWRPGARLLLRFGTAPQTSRVSIMLSCLKAFAQERMNHGIDYLLITRMPS